MAVAVVLMEHLVQPYKVWQVVLVVVLHMVRRAGMGTLLLPIHLRAITGAPEAHQVPSMEVEVEVVLAQ
jgi:hypothetical protein